MTQGGLLATWRDDEALHDAQVTEDQFVEKVERYGEVLRRLKGMGLAVRYEA